MPDFTINFKCALAHLMHRFLAFNEIQEQQDVIDQG
jgi:hypothetical protein